MVKEADAADAFTAKLTVNPQKSHRISDKLIGIFFEDISRAADGGLCAELLQNGDFEYNGERKGWNAATAWMGIEASSSSVSSSSSAIISTENGVSVNNPHYAIQMCIRDRRSMWMPSSSWKKPSVSKKKVPARRG